MSNYVIIGGSSAIGKELTSILLEEGHTVFATYNSQPIGEENEQLHTHQLNVLDTELDLSWAPETVEGLVYLPGSIQLSPFTTLKRDRVMQDIELHAFGAIPILQKLLPNLKKSDMASVAFISTVAVQTGFNFHAQVAMAKGAVEGLTRSLAAELAPKVRVNAIAPSITQTPMAEKFLNSETKLKANEDRHPLKKIGEAKDLAGLAQYMLSAKWMTGQVVTLDGGITSIR